jgi:hypothetical protein
VDAMEQELTDAVRRNFEMYKKYLRDRVNREYRKEYLLQGYQNAAYLAEWRALKMGKELNKLQQRIGRQRKANHKLMLLVKELEFKLRRYSEIIRELEGELADERTRRDS